MKFFFLICLIVSCGKHTSPLPEIFIQEEQLLIQQRSIITVVDIEKIKGVMSFRSETDKLFQVEINNEQEFKKITLELLSRNEKVQKQLNFFDEWSKLTPSWKEGVPELRNEVDVNFNFNIPGTKPLSLWLVNGKNYKKLQVWATSMRVILKQSELESILKGSSHLALSNEWIEKNVFDSADSLQSLKSKSYRVFYFNGEIGKVYYVSPELSFEQFLTQIGVEKVSTIAGQELYSIPNTNTTVKWWTRELEYKDRVLLFTSLLDVSNSYKEGFSFEIKKLIRKNGQNPGSMKIKKPKDALIYFTFRGWKTKRTFKESLKVVHYSLGIVKYHCSNWYRSISREEKQHLDFSLIDSSLIINSGNQRIELEQAHFKKTGRDERGHYYTFGLLIPEESVQIDLLQQKAGPFVETGIYNYVCSARTTPKESLSLVSTNEEGTMEISVETHIEKL